MKRFYHQSFTATFLMLFCFSLSAQNSNDARPVTKTFFIKNAFVVQKPGVILPHTSVLIQDGLITGIGDNVNPPFDAQIIEADSMYVYPAFIDACTTTGIKKKENKERPKVKNPANPPRDIAGITPQKSITGLQISTWAKTLKELNEAGFGYAHVVPRGRMLPGKGSIVLTGVENIKSSIINPDISLFAQFKSAPGVFPATTIGVMSQFRDLYKNAQYNLDYQKKYFARPTGLPRPNTDVELEAFDKVVNKKQSIFFYAPKVKDVNRAMILQKELGFDMVLTGVKQGWPLLDDIKRHNFSILLSLNLPKEIKEKDDQNKDTNDTQPDKKNEKKDKKKKKKKEDSPRVKALKERKKQAYDQYISQAALFEKSGTPFGFSSLDTKVKDIKPNILRMVEGGLSQEGALAALTTVPAKILGIDHIAGKIEKGYAGNVFITDKPYFEKKSEIKFIIHDGILKTLKKKKKKSKEKNKGIYGEWTYTVAIPEQERGGTILIEGEEGEYEVSMDSNDQKGEFLKGKNVEFEDDVLTFELSIEGMEISISIEIEGDTFEGHITGEFGEFPISGSKIPNLR